MAIVKGTVSSDLDLTPDFLAESDVVLGLDGGDTLDALGTEDNTLGGGSGNDTILPGSNTLATGDLGEDTLDAGDEGGDNLLYGGAGNDTLYAGVNDRVFGGSGDDLIYAGSSNNILKGGTGADRFFLAVAEEPTNPNTITDFNAAEDQLVVKLTGVTSFEDLTIEASGSDTIVKSNGVTLAVLTNTPVSALNPENLVTDENAPANSGVETNTVAETQGRTRVGEIESLGVVTFATGTDFEGTVIGGLSGIVYDRDVDVYYSISDDRSSLNPARFYTLTIDLSDGSLDDGDVDFTNVTTLLDANGVPFAANTIDFEGIALTENGSVYISSEGEARPDIPRLTNPSVSEFSLSGQQLSELPVGDKFNAVDGTTTGIRNDLAFESLTITPDGRYLYTATENALAQDGSAATVNSSSYSRIVKYDLTTGEVVAEYVYEVEPVADAPIPDGSFATNGLVELLAIDNNGTLLALERSFSTGVGNTVKLYEVLTQGALNVKDFEDLYREDALESGTIPPDRFGIDPFVTKRELLDFADLGITPDNLEGLAWGPVLEDGRQSLIVVSDNNFSDTQTTQVIALALDVTTLPAVLPTVETPYTIDDEEGTTPLIGDSDDPAVWIDPTDSGNSIVIGTLKDGGLAVFNLDGSLRQTYTPVDALGDGAEYGDIRYNNVDVLYNFYLGSEVVDIAVASDRANDTLAVFKINPETRLLENITDTTLSDAVFSVFGVDDGEATVYGLAGYRSPATGDFYIFVTQASGNLVAQLKLSATDNGTITAEVVRTIELPVADGDDIEDYQSEAIVVDQETGIVYVGVEGKLGIVKFDAEPTGSSEITIVRPIDSPELVPDLEGLGLYYGPNGTGYLIASSQGDSSYAVYTRDGSNAYLGSFVVGDNDALGIDQVNETDGLDIINVPLGSAFPFGAFLVQDGANDPQNVVENDDELENNATNFKFIPWESVANAFEEPLIVDTESYDPRTAFQAFPNGVASGDVDQDSAVLWTRSVLTGEVTFEYSTDPNFGTIAGTATAIVADSNIPVKVEVEGLEANTEYYYRVTNTSGDTLGGRFITAAAAGEQVGLTFGVSGDWRGEVTPYPAIRNIPDRNLDFFVALGDTVYADDGSPAVLNPDGTQKAQAETIEEFRAKHNEVYSDRFGENFWLEARGSTSILSSIDEHEVTNDFQGGADASTDDRFEENSGFINDAQLYENGLQAYQEYNPLRDEFYDEPGNDLFDGERKLYRYNTYGDDAAVITLDARSFRSQNLPAPNPTDLNAVVASYNASLTTPDRTLLGDVQLEDLKADLLAADAAGITWKFIMIPEPIQNILVGVNVDNYEGFARERAELLQFIDESNIENVVFIAADIHITTVNNLTYQTGDITSEQKATSIFEITTGSVAYDAPSGVLFAQGIAALSSNPAATLAFYNSLPNAPDADDVVNDKDDFVKLGVNGVYAQFPQPFDPIGLDDNLPQAQGLIDAELIQGDYFVSHSYSWTEFDIDPETQVLTVTTYGIDGYTEEDVDPENPDNRLEEVLASQPTIVSQFTVNPAVAPVVEDQTFSLAENSLVGTIVGTVAATDANENQQDLLTYSFTETNTRFAINASTGEITLVDATGLDFEADPTPQFTLEVTVTDPTGLSYTAIVTVNLTNVNEPPTITSNNTFSVAENTNAVGTITAIDPDANTVLTYSISGGADAAQFTIDPNSGVLVFSTIPDFENPGDVGADNSYNLQVQVSDGTNAVTQDLTVTVTDVNEAPVAEDTVFTIAENSLVDAAIGTVVATDQDAGDVLTYSITAGNTDVDGDGTVAFAIDSATGAITVSDSGDLDFENVVNTFALTVQVTDGELSDTAIVTVNLTNVNEPPTITSNNTFSVAENTNAVGTITAIDPNANTVLTYSISGGADAALFTIAANGALTFNAAPNFENPQDAGDNNIYNLQVQVTDGNNPVTQDLIITVTDVNEVPTAVSLTNTTPTIAENSSTTNRVKVADINITDDALGTETITLTSADAASFEVDGNALYLKAGTVLNHEAKSSYTVTINVDDTTIGNTPDVSTNFTLTVTDVNEAPTITSATTATFAENGTGTAYTVLATDPDAGTTLTYSLSGTDAARFNINSTTGAVTFTTPPNFEAPSDAGSDNVYNITVSASDGSLTASQAVAVTVTNVNEAPTITSATTATFAENGTGTAYTVLATDPDAGTTLTYSLSGTDAARFNINSTTGAVTFITPPNFEAPSDAGSDNVYNITVIASDGSLTASQAVAITVTNVDDTPPNPPTINNFTDNVTPLTGTFNNGSRTNDPTPTLNITAEAASTIRVFLPGGQEVSGSVDTTGTTGNISTYTFTPSTSLSQGNYSFTATATDAAGNISNQSNPFTLTVDTTPPSAPIIVNFTDDVAPLTGTLPSDSATNDSTPTLNITAEANSTVQVFRNGTLVGSAIESTIQPGNYTFVSAVLSPGTYSFTTRTVDAAGNVSNSSAIFSLIVDTIAPAPPTITGFTDDVAPVTGSITTSGSSTNDPTPILNITAEANSIVQVFRNGVSVGNAAATTPGGTNYTFSSNTLTDGSYAFTARATDSAGNVSAESSAFSLTVDTIAPAPPTITGFTDDVAPVTGSITTSGSSTNDPTPILNITAEANSIVQVFRNGVSVGNAAATTPGGTNYTFSSNTLTDGSYAFTARATDSAGNVSAESSAFNLTVDTIAPASPTIREVSDDVGSITGNLISGQNSDDSLPVLTITAAQGSTIKVFNGTSEITGSALVTGTANGISNYRFTPTVPLGSGLVNLRATATNAAGLTSSDSAPFSYTLDRQPPAAPTIASIGTENLFAAVGGTISGTGEVGATVTLQFNSGRNLGGGTSPTTTTVNSAGNWSVNVSPEDVTAFGEGAEQVTVTQRDVAGNQSPSITQSFNVFTTDVRVSIDRIEEDRGQSNNNFVTNDRTLTLVGKATAGSTVTITIGTTNLGGTVSPTGNGLGDWSYDIPGSLPANQTTTIAAFATLAGISSPTVTQNVVIDTVSPTLTTTKNVGDTPANIATGPITYTFTFNERVLDFVASKVLVAGGSKGLLLNPSGDQRTYTMVVTPNQGFEGNLTVTVDANEVRDLAGNLNTVNVEITQPVDFLAPTITSGGVATPIPENSGVNQLVYRATALGNGNTLSLKANTGDGSFFTIDTNTGQVRLTSNPNFESKPSYTFTVVATDAAGNTSEQAVTLAILNLDEAAPIITSGNTASAIAENSGANQVIYTAVASDTGDISAGVRYSLKANNNDDASGFTINPNTGQVRLISNPDFETKSNYGFTVVATDGAGNASEQAVTLGITNVNESPIAIALDNNSLPENGILVVGRFTTTDPDSSDTFQYTLVEGTGSVDNNAFNLTAGELSFKGAPDFETKSNYSIRVRSTDGGSLSTERVFTINVTDTNDAPSAINLDSTTVNENVPGGTVVGLLSSTDLDTSPQNFLYTLVPGTGGVDGDNNSFVIVGTQLQLSVSPDFEARSSYRINVRTTDQGGLFRDQAFTINVRDLREALNDQITREDTPITALTLPVVGAPGATSYQLISLDGTKPPSWLSFNSSTRQVSGTPPINFAGVVTLRLNELGSTGNLLGSYGFNLVVQNVNDVPTTTNASRTGPEDGDITLQLPDFAFTDVDSPDALKAVQISNAPTVGSLLLNGNPVIYPLQVTREEIRQGSLRFRPLVNANGQNYATFQFQVLDQGDAVSVPATFTINLTPVNDPATGRPAVTGTLQEGQTISVNTGGIADVDGLPTSFNYRWFRASVDSSDNPGLFQEISGITTSTYQLSATDINQVIQVQVSFTDQGGNLETVSSNPTNPIQNRPDSAIWNGQQVTGTPTQGQTLTVNTSGIVDADRLGSFSYQWQESRDNSVWIPISGATGTSLRLTQSQVGKFVRNLVAFTDGYDNPETLTSSPTTQVANINDTGSGTPQITGTPAKGQTLGVLTQGLNDPDGIDSSTFAYQWQQSSNGNNWSNIPGATSSTFTLGDAQVNNQLRVQVSYLDYPGGPEAQRTTETRLSASTALISNSNLNPVEGSVILTLGNGNPLIGAPSQNQILIADTTSIRDGDGIGALSYEWSASGQVISGATGDRLTLGQPQVGKQIAVRVSYTDGGGSKEEISSASTPSVLNENDPASASLIVTGARVQNQTLRALLSSITDLDGAPSIERDAQNNITNYQFQWQQSSDGNTWSNIAGATTAGLTLTEALVIQRLRVTVSFTDNGGSRETVTSAATNPIINVNDAPVGLPTITGAGLSPNQGQTLTANTTGISDIDGLGSFNYQWQRLNGTTWEAIIDANAPTYNPGQGDVNRSLRVQVSYIDGRGTRETLTSTATGLVIDLPDSPTGQPTISGTPTQGELLTADPNSIADLDGLGIFSYQWQRQQLQNGAWNNIPNATGSTYRLTQAEVGRPVRVQLSYIDGIGTRETLTSNPTAVIANVNDAPSGSVIIVGTPVVGVPLSVDIGSLVDPDGLGTFSYQWLANGQAIANATNNTYTPVSNDLDKTLTVRVTYTDQGGTQETVLSPNSLAVISADQLLSGEVSIISTDGLTGSNANGDLIAQENVTLVADTWTTQISFNGEPQVEFSYQWYADGVTITSANNEIFTPGDDQVGKVITVTVTPKAGNIKSSLKSKGTAPVENVNDLPGGAPTFTGLVNGAAQEDSTLTADVSGIGDADGIAASTPFSFQWQQSSNGSNWTNITNATGRSFTPGDAQSGQRLRLITTYTDLHGTTETVTTPVGSLSDTPGLVRAVNDAPTGSVGINGFLVVGQVLTAASTLADADGIPSSGAGSLTYTWQQQNPATGVWSNIATGTNYTITEGVSGSRIRVSASYTDQQGFSQTTQSLPTTIVVRNPREGRLITWSSSQATTSQWQVFSSTTGVWQNLPGQTATTLQTNNDLGGREVRLLLNGTPTPTLFIQPVDNGVGSVNPITVAASSSQSSFVLGATLEIGTVAGDPDGLDPNSTNVIYQWQRSTTSNGVTGWVNILDEGDKATYLVTNEDLNENLRVQVTYTDLQSFTSTIYSPVSKVIEPTPPPVASGSFDAMTANGDDIASAEEFPLNNTSTLAGGLTLTGQVTSPTTSVTLNFGGQTRVARLAIHANGDRRSDVGTSATNPVAWSYTLTEADITWLVGNADNQFTARFTRQDGDSIGTDQISRTLFISEGVLAERNAPTVIDASQPGGLSSDVLRNLQAIGVKFSGVDPTQPNAVVFTYGTSDEFNAGADTPDPGTGAGINTSTGAIQGIQQFGSNLDGTYTIPGADGSSTPISSPSSSSFTAVADPLAMTVSGVQFGATVTANFYLPANVASRLGANNTPIDRWAYYKLDNTDNQFKPFEDTSGDLYRYLYRFRIEGGNNNNLWEEGEQVVLTLTLTDGDKWDRDGLVNGVIVDPGLAGLAVNQAPTITSATTATFAENGTGTAYNVLATDPDAGTTLTYSLSGTDAARFNMNSTTGAVTFTTAPDFEAPSDAGSDNVYNITVSVSDGSLTASQAVAVTVTNVNEAPSFAAPTASFSTPENSLVDAAIGTVVATDPDTVDFLTYSLDLDDENNDRDEDGELAFVIDEETGVITVNDEDELDFEENPTFTLEVTVVDPSGLSDTAVVTVNLTDVDEQPPTITSDNTFSVAENTNAVGTITAIDPDANTVLTYSISGGDDAALFTIDNTTGKLSFIDAPDFENPEDVGENNIYNLQVQVTDGTNAVTQDLTVTVTDELTKPIDITGIDLNIPPSGESVEIEYSDEAAIYLKSLFKADQQAQVAAVLEEAGDRIANFVDRFTYSLAEEANIGQVIRTAAQLTSAAFSNLLGFYRVIDALTGAVEDADGNQFLPGEDGYAEAALGNVEFNIQVGGSQTLTVVGNVTLAGDTAYAPFVIANGAQFASNIRDVFVSNPGNQAATRDNFTSLPVVYFGFALANPDFAPHIKRLRGDVFAFEDLPAGVGVSDYDFNDATFTFG